MKYRYTKFTGDLIDDLDLEDLVSKLSDLLLSSGFGDIVAGDRLGAGQIGNENGRGFLQHNSLAI